MKLSLQINGLCLTVNTPISIVLIPPRMEVSLEVFPENKVLAMQIR